MPIVTIALVLASVVVYVLSIAHGGDFLDGPSRAVVLRHGAVPFELTHAGGRWTTVFEAIFLHGGLLHLLLDMYFLVLFAPSVEDACGHAGLLALFVAGALVALALALLFAPNSSVPVLTSTGAVAAVLGAYLLLYPRARVISLALIPFLATIVEVPALLLLALWFAVQLWFGLAALADPVRGDWAIAYAAQAGAFAFGTLAIVARSHTSRAPANGARA
jgi:membrane associated rhomboid family serine protease